MNGFQCTYGDHLLLNITVLTIQAFSKESWAPAAAALRQEQPCNYDKNKWMCGLFWELCNDRGINIGRWWEDKTDH